MANLTAIFGGLYACKPKHIVPKIIQTVLPSRQALDAQITRFPGIPCNPPIRFWGRGGIGCLEVEVQGSGLGGLHL